MLDCDLRDGVRCNLVTSGVKILNLAVVGPFMRDVKGGSDRTTVRIETARFEQIAVQILVQVIDRVVKSQQDQLRYVFNAKTAWKNPTGQRDGPQYLFLSKQLGGHFVF